MNIDDQEKRQLAACSATQSFSGTNMYAYNSQNCLLLQNLRGTSVLAATDYSQFFSISPSGCGTLSGCELTTSGGGSVASLGLTVGSDGSIIANTDAYFYGNTSVVMTCTMSGQTYTSSFDVSINNYCSLNSNWNVNSGAFSAQADIIQSQLTSTVYTHTYSISTFFSINDPWKPYCLFENCKIVNYIVASLVCGTTEITSPISFTLLSGTNYQLSLDRTNLGEDKICYQCQVISNQNENYVAGSTSNYNYRTISNGWVYWQVTDNPCYNILYTNVQGNCQYTRQSDDNTYSTTFEKCAFVASDSLTGYQNYNYNGNSLCTIKSYTLYTTQNQVMTVVSSSQLVLGSTSGELDVRKFYLLSSSYYRIKITLQNDYTSYTNWFIVDVTCGTTSQIITNPSNYSTSADQTQTFCIKNTQIPVFTFGKFINFGNQECTISAYYQYKDSTAASKATNMVSNVYWNNGYLNVLVSSGFYYVPAVYTFALQVYATGGFTYWAQVGSNTQNTLNVICCFNSTTITISTTDYTSSLSNIQYVDISLTTTYFILPKITTQIAGCQITYYQSTSSGSTYIAATNVNDPSVYDGTYLKVSPIDISLNSVYTFYVYVQANGGAYSFSELYTLIVGCVQSKVTFTFPSFVSSHTLHVADSSSQVYHFNAVTTVPTYCTVQSYTIVTLSTTAGSTSQFYMKKSATCLSADNTCTYVDISTTSNITTILWYIKVTSKNGVTQNSNQITTQVLCQTSSTSVYASSPTVNSTLRQYNTTNNTLTFPVFTCQYTDCCSQITYYILKSSSYSLSNVYNPSLFSYPLQYDSAKYKTTVYTGAIQVYYYYIYGCNPYNACNVTYQMKVNVTYNCLYDVITLSPIMPVEATEPMANSYKQRSGLPVLIFNKELGSIQSFSVDLTRRFQNNASYYCNIIAYQITKVSVLNTNFQVPLSVWKYIFTINNSSGIFQIIKFNQPFYNYIVYFQAYNGLIWGGDSVQYLVDATITTADFIPIYPPTFVQSVNDISNSLLFKVNVTKYINGSQKVTDNRIIQFQLPQTDDFYKLPVAIVLNNQREVPFLKINQNTGVISVNTSMISMNEIGGHILNIYLIDAMGATRIYNITMTIYSSLNIIQQPQQTKIKQDYSFQGRQVVSAYIESIDEYGMMKIAFNETMFTDFNLSLINQTSVQIYILPALKRNRYEGFDPQSINLTWKLEAYNSSGMFIQLYFKRPLEISPLVIFDQVVWNVTSSHQLFYSLISNQSQAFGQFGYKGGRNLQPVNQKVLYKDFYVLKAKVRKQFPQNIQSYKYLFDYLDIFVNLLFANSLLSLFFGILFSNTVWMTLAYIRYLQITLHLPMMKVIVPTNVIIFMKKTLPVPKLDILKWFYNQYQATSFFDKNFQNSMRDQIYDQTWELGYQNHNALMNLSSISFAIPIFLITMIIFFIVVYILQIVFYDQGYTFYPYQLTYQIFSKLKRLILFGFILFIMIFGFMEMTIASKYAILIFKIDPMGELFSSVYAVIGIFSGFIVLPILFIWFLCKYFNNRQKSNVQFEGGNNILELRNLEINKDLQKDKYISKKSFSILIYQIKQTEIYICQYMFYPLCVIRRLLYLVIVFYIDNSTYQLLSMLSLNLISLIYVGHSYPMRTPLQNGYEFYSQLSICAVTFHMIYFTAYSSDYQSKFNYGTSMITIICLHLIFTLIYSCILYINYIKLIFHALLNKMYEALNICLFKPIRNYFKSLKEKKIVFNEKQIDLLINAQNEQNDEQNKFKNQQIGQIMKSRKRVGKQIQLKKAITLNMSEIKEQSKEISNDELQETLDDQNLFINVLKDNVQNISFNDEQNDHQPFYYEEKTIQKEESLKDDQINNDNFSELLNPYYQEPSLQKQEEDFLKFLKEENAAGPFYYQFEEKDGDQITERFQDQEEEKYMETQNYSNNNQDYNPFYYSFNEKQN